MKPLEKWVNEFCYKLKNIKFNLSAEHLILVSEELETGESAAIDEYIKLSGQMIRQQQAEIEFYKEALEKLARLGNGDNYGNSIGNDIAIDALRKAQEK